MPAIHEIWNNFAVDNDLKIQSNMTFMTERGPIDTLKITHLMAEENLSIHVRTGFEKGYANGETISWRIRIKINKRW